MVDHHQDHIEYGTTDSGELISIPRLAHDGVHTRCQGASGSGKTAAVANNARQFLRPYHRKGQVTRDFVQILDFGGSQLMKACLEVECRELGVSFRCFHLDSEFSEVFDPLVSSGVFRGNPARKAMFVCSAFNMSQGEGEQRYFSKMNVEIACEAFRELEEEGIVAPEMHQLAAKLREMSKRPRHAKHASEALFALTPLLHYPQFSLGNAPAECRISIAESMDRAECLYFYLPTIFDGPVARAAGNLALWSTVIEAADRVHRGLPEQHTSIYVDEAGQLVGPMLLDIITLVRKFHCRMTLAYQTKALLEG